MQDNLIENGNITVVPDNCDQLTQPSVVFGSIMIAVVIIGLIGNSLVFFTILVLHEYKKSVTNWYILQLTLADTLFLLMLPFTAHSEVVGTWEFSPSLCKFKEAVIFINYYASIYFLVIMSFDRYLAVTKAFDSRKWMTTLRSPTASYIISAVGWIISALACVQLYRYSIVTKCKVCEYQFPGMKSEDIEYQILKGNENEYEDEDFPDPIYENYGSIINLYRDRLSDQNDNESKKFDGLLQNITDGNATGPPTFETNSCAVSPSNELNVWVYGNFLGAFVFPFILICYFYGMIMKTVTSTNLVESNLKQKSYRRRVTMIVFGLVTLFAVTWLPWYIQTIVSINVNLPYSTQTCQQIRNAVRGIAYMNSALNPYFYSFLGFHFRDRLKRAGSRVRLVITMRKSTRSSSSMRRKNRYNSSSLSAGYRMNQNAVAMARNASQERDRSSRNRAGTATFQKTEKTEL